MLRYLRVDHLRLGDFEEVHMKLRTSAYKIVRDRVPEMYMNKLAWLIYFCEMYIAGAMTRKMKLFSVVIFCFFKILISTAA